MYQLAVVVVLVSMCHSISVLAFIATIRYLGSDRHQLCKLSCTHHHGTFAYLAHREQFVLISTTHSIVLRILLYIALALDSNSIVGIILIPTITTTSTTICRVASLSFSHHPSPFVKILVTL